MSKIDKSLTVGVEIEMTGLVWRRPCLAMADQRCG